MRSGSAATRPSSSSNACSLRSSSMQGAGDAQLAGEADRRRVVDRLVGVDRGIEVLLVDVHVADQERRLGQVRLQEQRQAGVEHGPRAALLLMQRLSDAPQRIGHAAGGAVERRRQDAPGLELGEHALQDRLIGPLRHLLADQPERGVASRPGGPAGSPAPGPGAPAPDDRPACRRAASPRPRSRRPARSSSMAL